jgi:hypothetical protein
MITRHPVHHRFSQEHIDTWRGDGVVLIPRFFTGDEVAAVAADFEHVFGRGAGGTHASMPKKVGERALDPSQQAFFGPVPFDCSPALNLAPVHPQLVELARRALATDDVLLYQSVVWAKFTGHADYDQPFHCDYMTHTLTAPAPPDQLDAVTFTCYFSDVSEEHGPMHYVPRSQGRAVAPPEASLVLGPALDEKLAPFERSTASPAGSIFLYAMDVYHRATNLRAPGGQRYTVFASFKRASNHAVGYHAWPLYDIRPWHRIFDHATPDQLACFGVPRPGDRFWTEATIAQTKIRYPGWNTDPYRAALRRT